MIKHSEVQSLFSIYAAAKVESENTNSEFNQWVKANKPPTGIPFTSDIHQLILKGRWNLYESQRRQLAERLLATQDNMILARRMLHDLVYDKTIHQSRGRYICHFKGLQFVVASNGNLTVEEIKNEN